MKRRLLFLLFFPFVLQTQPCMFSNIVTEASECNEDNQYTIDFEFDNPQTTGSFDVFLGADYITTFDYGESFYTIGPVDSYCGEEDLFIFLSDTEDDDCALEWWVDAPCCVCSFVDAYPDPTFCYDDGTFDVYLTYEIENSESSSFTVYVNGVLYGDNFSYDEPFVVVEGLSGDCETLYEFELVDNEDPACTWEMSLEEVVCCEMPCTISDLEYFDQVCGEDGTYTTLINFNVENPGNDYFEVWIDGNYFDNFLLIELPVEIGPLSTGLNSIIDVCINDVDDCCASMIVEPPICPEEGDCSFSYLIAESGACNDDDQFYVDFEITVENPVADSFEVYIGGSYIENLPYGEESYTIGPLTSDCSEVSTITLIDVLDSTCFIEQGFIIPCCDENLACSFFDFFYETYECDENNQFLVDFEFNYENPISDSFIVYVNDDLIDVYNYAESFYTMGPFDGDCETSYEVFIQDWNSELCTLEYLIEPVCCEEEGVCEIYGLEAYDLECESEETYSLYISFGVENGDNDFFDLFVDGEFEGFYSLDDLPLMIDGVLIDGYTLIEVCLNDNEDCCAILEVEAPDCSAEGDCAFDDLFVETYECDEEGNFLIDFSFEVVNPDAGSFNVHINGDYYGNYAYGESFYTIGPFDGDCETEYLISLYDELNDGCTISSSLGPVCCEEEEVCEIYGLEAYDLECESEETYSLYISFGVENGDNDFFDLVVDGEFEGFYSLDELPLMIDGVVIDGYTLIEVCLNDNEDCCAVLEVEAPDCSAEGDCAFDDLLVETYECDEEGNFLIDFTFEVVNPDAGSFNVHINGDYYGNYAYGESFYTIGPFDGDCESEYLISLYDELNDGCTISSSFGPVCCEEEGVCEIYGLEAYDFECESEDTYSLYISFGVENGENDFFDLFVDGEFEGFYSLEDLPLMIDGVLIDGNTVVEVCINDNEDCCSIIEFEPPDCSAEGDCLFTELYIETYGCDDDDNFLIDFEFTIDNPEAGSFNVFVNGVYLDNLAYGEDYYTVGPFEGDCETEYTLYVEDELDNDCNIESLFGPVCCGEEDCEISELAIFDIVCDEDGLGYSFYVDFEVENPGNDYFEVWIDGVYLDFYLLEELPLHIEDMLVGEDVVITVCINDMEDCCQEMEVESPECEEIVEDCEFTNLEIEIGACNDDGLFYVDFWFDISDPISDSFVVYLNGDTIGSFVYGEDYYTIHDIVGDCSTEYLLYIEDPSLECAIEDIFGQVCCDEPLFSIAYFDNTIYVSDAPEDFSFKVFQASGRYVAKYFVPGSGEYPIDQFDASIYILSYEYEGKLQHKKIVKH